MSDELLFMMAQREVRFPIDRNYATNHMWAASQGKDLLRFGFTAYAVRLMLDVYFLEWHIESGTKLQSRQEIGTIESKKAESSLFAPIAGHLARFNENLLSDPSTINLDCYGDGWLFEIAGSGDELLSPEAYLQHVTSVWKITQKTIRGI